jgi:hypothetical protein
MKLSFLTKSLEQPDFVARSIFIAVVAAASVSLGLLFWRLSDFLPLVFATIILAIAWRSGAESLSARFKIPLGLSLLAAALGLIAVIAATLTAFGNQLLSQYDEVALDIPAAVALIQRFVEEHPWGRFVEKFVIDADYSNAALRSGRWATVSLWGSSPSSALPISPPIPRGTRKRSSR